MTTTFLQMFLFCLLSIMLFQTVLSLLQFVLSKNKVYLFYCIYLFVILFNFSQNIQLNEWSQLFRIENKYCVIFVGLPINFIINATYMLFYNEYFLIKKTNPNLFKKMRLLFFGNIICCIIQFCIELLFPNKSYYINYIVLVITLLMVCYPLFAMWKEKLNDYYYILLGSLFLMIGFILSIVAFAINKTFNYTIDTDLIAVVGAVAELLFFNYAIQDRLAKNEKALIIAEQEKQHMLAREHMRLSADLHDEVGSTLSSIHILSAIMQKKVLPNDLETKKYATQLTTQVATVMQSISDIVWGFRTDLNTVDDILIRFQEIANQNLEPRNINYFFEIQPEVKKLVLNNMQRTNLLLVFKEAIHNIVKYANASVVKIDITCNDYFLVMTITDNGIGFNKGSLVNTKGNGLRNMEKRMEQIKGRFQIISTKNEGTELVYKLPI